MSTWTKRPQNYCLWCGYSWYPRGKDLSYQCPRCFSTGVTTDLDSFPESLESGVALCPESDVALLLSLVGLAIDFVFRVLQALPVLVRFVAVEVVVPSCRWAYRLLRNEALWLISLEADKPFQFICKLLCIVPVGSFSIIGVITGVAYLLLGG
jgi:hypothetical protein